MALGAIAAAIGAAAQLAGTGFNIWSGLQKPKKPSTLPWERARTPAALAFSTYVYNPLFTGLQEPYAQGPSGFPVFAGQVGAPPYEFRPPTGLEALYRFYLERNYGIPQSVARAMTAQALGPLRAQVIPTTPALARTQALPSAEDIAKAALGLREVPLAEAENLLRSAAQLTAFENWRAQMLRELL